MAETYHKILPGNWTVPLSAYPLPAAKTKPGAADGRQQQSVLFMPGFKAVHKVAYAFIDDTGGTSFDLILPSPDTRPDDKPRADVKGLFIPKGVFLYRVGLRAPGVELQPGYYSSGARGTNPFNATGRDSGLTGTATDRLVLSSATPVASAGTITATKAQTASQATCNLIFGADGRLKANQESVTQEFKNFAATTADLTLKVFSIDNTGAAAGGTVKADLLGGVYLVAEACYLVPDDVADIADGLKLPGARYSGYE